MFEKTASIWTRLRQRNYQEKKARKGCKKESYGPQLKNETAKTQRVSINSLAILRAKLRELLTAAKAAKMIFRIKCRNQNLERSDWIQNNSIVLKLALKLIISFQIKSAVMHLLAWLHLRKSKTVTKVWVSQEKVGSFTSLYHGETKFKIDGEFVEIL